MKKSVFTGIALICMITLSCNLKAQQISAAEQNKKLARGVNIIGYDKELWKDHSKGRFKEKYFKMIREAGFSNIRINMHPFSYMDSNYTINPEWLETLDWAVKNGLEAGLMVILDMHEYIAIAEDPVAKKEMFLSVWKQLAPRYKDQSGNLIFEILNEPNGKLTPQLWNTFLLEAVKLIRTTNPTRTLISGPGNWNGIEALPSLVLPEDDRNIIVTVHFYHPMKFTHQGAFWTEEYANLQGITWTGTKEEKEEVDTKLKVAANWSKTHDRPIFLGEFGSYDKGEMESRARYTAYVARTAEKLGFSWAYWQFDDDFIVYDITKDQWIQPLLDALINKPK